MNRTIPGQPHCPASGVTIMQKAADSRADRRPAWIGFNPDLKREAWVEAQATRALLETPAKLTASATNPREQPET
jgi:hypothetical protein